ncbi:MAG: stage II sporulation protein M [Nostocoides sp.]
MDLDAYVGQHRPTWHRLEDLLGRRRRTARQCEELLDLYQRVSTHLSTIQSEAPDPTVTRYLSALIARARVVSAARRSVSLAQVGQFFTVTFPGTLYWLRWWWGITTVVNVLVGFAVGWWTVHHPEVYASVLSAQAIDHLVSEDFTGYYSEYAHHEFAAAVWTNNAWVAAQCIAFGVLGFPVIQALWANIVNVGIIGALMTTHGRAGEFWSFILPHGLLELTAVFVAAGTGLRLFWSWISPGGVTRSQSMARAGRSAMAVAMGLVVVLLVSGVIEGFVTPSSLPPAAKLAIGIVALAGFLGYVFSFGRAAARAGEAVDMDRRLIGDETPVAG